MPAVAAGRATFPTTAARNGAQLADLVLKAADKFNELLAAYRNNAPLPDARKIRQEIQQLVPPPNSSGNAYKLHGRFEWTEYEQLTMEDAARNGQSVYNIAVAVDPACGMPAAAVQMIRSSLKEAATILASYPGEADLIAQLHPLQSFCRRSKIDVLCLKPEIRAGTGRYSGQYG